jgi:hypothetical protein
VFLQHLRYIPWRYRSSYNPEENMIMKIKITLAFALMTVSPAFAATETYDLMSDARNAAEKTCSPMLNGLLQLEKKAISAMAERNGPHIKDVKYTLMFGRGSTLLVSLKFIANPSPPARAGRGIVESTCTAQLNVVPQSLNHLLATAQK